MASVMVNVGVDLGQKRDPTAVAVAEVEHRLVDGGRVEAHHVCRFLERLPLGTPYPRVARRLAEVVRHLEERVPGRWVAGRLVPAHGLEVAVWADATGLGQPVVDLLLEAGVAVTPCYFTHGDRRSEGGGVVTLGKGWLVSRLKTLFQTGRVHLPRTPEALAMERELLDYEVRVAEDANERYGAFAVGSHDDLVTALGLAVQGEEGAVLRPASPGLLRYFDGLPR